MGVDIFLDGVGVKGIHPETGLREKIVIYIFKHLKTFSIAVLKRGSIEQIVFTGYFFFLQVNNVT